MNNAQRRTDPNRNMVESELFTVQNYYPEFGTCDLFPASINQRGELSQVPIQCGFGGSWEAQSSHQPSVAGFADPNQFGNAPRGPRWGMNFPIEPGDLAIVQYLGASQSDPIITGFIFWRGNYAVPWLANQVLSQENDYTTQTPVDDDLLTSRFDLLLPSGAWLRSTQAGSWVMATSPVDRAKAFIVLDANGTIRIKGRADEDYKTHLEFDPSKDFGRIVVGSLEDGSFLEFKDGDVTLKAKKRLQFLGEEVRGDCRVQNSGSAMDVLTSTPSTSITDADLPGLMNQAAGEMVLQGVATTSPVPPGVVALTTQPLDTPALTIIRQDSFTSFIRSSLLSNPAIDGALRGRIGDFLSNPQGLLNRAIEDFRGSLPNDLAIGDRLGKLLGANALAGSLGTFTSRLDLNSLPMIRELGIPSWVGRGIQNSIEDGNSLSTILDLVPEMSDNQILNEICSKVGAIALNGGTAPGARNILNGILGDLDGEFQERIQGLLTQLDSTPLRTPRNGEGVDWTGAAAQRLGRFVLRGNNFLGGPVALFNLGQIGLDDADFARVRRVANQVQGFAANPHRLIENLPSDLEPHMPQVTQIPTEIRDAISRVPQDLLGRLPNLASGLLGRLEGVALESEPDDLSGCDVFLEPIGELITSRLPAWLPEERALGSLIQSAPRAIQQTLQDLPTELLSGLSSIDSEQFGAILENPQSWLDGLDTGMIQNLFGGLTSANVGTFDMRVTRRAQFSIMPQASGALTPLNNTEFHRDTVTTQIERSNGYGRIQMPDWWGGDRPSGAGNTDPR